MIVTAPGLWLNQRERSGSFHIPITCAILAAQFYCQQAVSYHEL